MNTDSLRWRRQTAKALAKLALPIIDGYLRVVAPRALRKKLSQVEASVIAIQAAPRFAELILMEDEPLWPDLPELILIETRRLIFKRLTVDRHLF